MNMDYTILDRCKKIIICNVKMADSFLGVYFMCDVKK